MGTDGTYNLTYNAGALAAGTAYVEVATDDTQSGNEIESGPAATATTSPGATNNSPSSTDPVLQSFLDAAEAQYNTTSVTSINGTASGTTAATFAGGIGVVNPGGHVALKVTDDAAIFADGGARLNLSSSPRLDASGNHLKVDVELGTGNNTVKLNHGPSTAHSTTGNDTLISGGGHDSLYGGFGQDSLLGGGHSKLYGGEGAGDTLHGGTSNNAHDTIYAGSGGDKIVTDLGQNLVYGNTNDTIDAGSAQDTILAGTGPETIHGGLGSTIYGGGASVMDGGYDNTYKATGADTIYGSNHNNTVVIQGQSDGVVVDGRTGTGALDVTLQSTNQGDDTLFGGYTDPVAKTGSNLTIHVSQNFTEEPGTDQNGLHVVQLAGGQTLHVTNVTIDFNDKKTYV